MPDIESKLEEFDKEVMSEEEFRENTMGCFYQDELREAFRKIKPWLTKAFQEIAQTSREEVKEDLYEKYLKAKNGDFSYQELIERVVYED